MIEPKFPFHAFKYEFHTIRELIDWSGNVYKGHDAFRFLQNGKIIARTYDDFLHDVQYAGQFFHRTFPGQSHIAVLGATSYLWMVAWSGVLTCGLVAVPIDRLLKVEEIVSLLERADVSALIFDESCSKAAREIQDACPDLQCIPMTGGAEEYNLQAYIQREKAVGEPAWAGETAPQDVAEIVFTSGTTGSYKGCVLTQDNLSWNAMNGSSYVALTPEDKTLSILPIHHTLEITAGMLTPFCSGVTICINDSLRHVQRNLNLFHTECMIAVPMVVETLHKTIWMEAKKTGQEKKLHFALYLSRALQKIHIHMERKLFSAVLEKLGGNLKLLVVGGAHLKPELVTEFSAMGITIVQGYGVTECGPVVACNTDRKWKADSVGQAVTGCEIKLVDGEIWVAGPIVMKGYYKDKNANREAFEGRWYKTGDLGRLDENGYLYLTGRKKNLIIRSNGENVAPEELEEKLQEIEGVEEALVYDENELITAELFTHRKDGLQEQVEILNRQLPPYKRIQKVKFREKEFEKTTTQKIKR